MPSSEIDLEHLKLAALDAEDLAVLSAHLQDAVVTVGDLAFLPDEGRFALLARRFDWDSDEARPRRRLTGLHFDRVLRCRTRGIDRSRKDEVLSLLAVTFTPGDEPSGIAELVFAGGVTVQLHVECVEARLKDLGPVWACAKRPAHALEES